jgi:hypothetical protein
MTDDLDLYLRGLYRSSKTHLPFNCFKASEINFWCYGLDLTVRPVRTVQAWLLIVTKDDF